MPSRIHVSLALLGLSAFLNACPSAEPRPFDLRDDDDATDLRDDDDATSDRADFRNATAEQLALALKTAADAHGWAFMEAADNQAQGLVGTAGCPTNFVVSVDESVFSAAGCTAANGVVYSGEMTATTHPGSAQTFDLNALQIGEGGQTHELNGSVAYNLTWNWDLALQTNLRVDGSHWQGATVMSGSWSVRSDLDCGSAAASTCMHGASSGWVDGLGSFDIAGRVPYLREYNLAPPSGWVTLSGQQLAEFDLSQTDVDGCVRYTLDGASAGVVCLDY
jgi:hypothetical protein